MRIELLAPVPRDSGELHQISLHFQSAHELIRGRLGSVSNQHDVLHGDKRLCVQ